MLVAIDRSTTLGELAPVVELARATGWAVDLLHVFPPESAFVGNDDLGGRYDPDGSQADLDAAWLLLNGLASGMTAQDIVVTPSLFEGAPAEVIVNRAEEMDSTQIVLIGRTKAPARRMLLGSTVSVVLRTAGRPVLVTPSGEDGAVGGFRTSLQHLKDALTELETNHPDLTRAINDVSYYLSGMGI